MPGVCAMAGVRTESSILNLGMSAGGLQPFAYLYRYPHPASEWLIRIQIPTRVVHDTKRLRNLNLDTVLNNDS